MPRDWADCYPRCNASYSGLIWGLWTVAPRTDLPDRIPPYQRRHQRSHQWVRSRVLQCVPEDLAQALHDGGCLDLREALIEGRIAPVNKGAARAGKTNRGNGSKITALAIRPVRPTGVHVGSAAPHAVTLVTPPLRKVSWRRILNASLATLPPKLTPG